MAAPREIIWRHLTRLAADIGPRPACSEQERRAHEYCAAEMSRWAASVSVEPFRSCPTFSWPWMLVAGLALTGSLLAGSGRPAWGFLPAAAAAALLVGFGRHALELGRIFPQGASQNVGGVIPARRRPTHRLVLAAHADTTRSALFWHPRLGRYFDAVFLTMAAAVLILPLLSAAALAGYAGLRWPAVLAGLPVLAGLLVLVHREWFGQWVPGALDNASGVAVTLGVGQSLSASPLEHTEVWLVITGCEEVGYPAGMARFCDAHRQELQRDASVVAVDMVGAGRLAYETGEGMLGARPCDPRLVRLMARVAGRHPEWDAAGQVVPVYNDTIACLVRGIAAGTLGSRAAGPERRPYHWPDDRIEHVDPAVLQQAHDFLMELARDLDREVAPPE